MANRLTPNRMNANALDKALRFPDWIRRKPINDRLNYIVRMYSETCGDNWLLWIETAVETLPILIYALEAVSTVDVIKGVLEEDYRCGLRQKSAKSKRAARSAAARAKNFFWKVEGVRAKLFWYWLIIDVVTQYVVNWQSIVVEEQRCPGTAHAGPCILDTPGSTLGSIIGSTSIFYRNIATDPSGWASGTATPTVIHPDAVGEYNVGFQISCIWGSLNQITWHCEILDGFGHIVATGASVTSIANNPSTSSCFGQATCLSGAQAEFTSRIVVTQSPGGSFGTCLDGNFSVGVFTS
jgi:hypothetical protein